MTVAERLTIERIYKKQIRILSKLDVANPIMIDKRFLPVSKGKSVLDSDIVYRSSSSSLISEEVTALELFERVNEGFIMQYAHRAPESNDKLCESHTAYIYPRDMYEYEDDLDVLYSSKVLRFTNTYDYVANSKTLYIENINLEAEKEKKKANKLYKSLCEKYSENEKILENKIAFAFKMETDPEFTACLDRLIRYRGAESNDLYLLHPDKIVEECVEKDNVKLCSLILNSFEKQSVEDDIKNLCFNHESMKVSSLRSFLKRIFSR